MGANMDDNTDDAEREIALKETAAALTAEPYWGLARALEWAACQSIRDMARLHLPGPGRAFIELFGSEVDGTRWLSIVNAAEGGSREESPHAALLTALRQGKLSALGRRGGEWRTIESFEWGGTTSGGGLSIAYTPSLDEPYVRESLRTGYGRRAFDEIRFERTALWKAFPPVNAARERTNQTLKRQVATAKEFVLRRADDENGVQVTQAELADFFEAKNETLAKRDKPKVWKALRDDPKTNPHIVIRGRRRGSGKIPRQKTPRR